MTARQPFTRLCQQLSRPRLGRVDLHIHTTYSDGAYTPAQVVDLARRSGLPAVAITDHDTIAGLAPASRAAGTAVEIITGIELSCQFRGRSLHLLGYFFQPADSGLSTLLDRLRQHRLNRFQEMVARLGRQGIALDARVAGAGATLGRRHLAELLVNAGRVGTIREAFLRYLSDEGTVHVPNFELPVTDGIRILRSAGGVAAWAHPPYDCTREALTVLRDDGMQAVEVVWPSCKPSRRRELRSWALELGLAVTGGSDCHGPGHHHRAIGAGGITVAELEKLRELALTASHSQDRSSPSLQASLRAYRWCEFDT